MSKIYDMNTLKKPIVVNLYAGPGTGKSTCAAQIFSELKWKGVNCEITPEFAKEKVWEESLKVLDDQIYIFAKQLHKMRRLVGKVDVIITDSPLLFSVMYDSTQNKNLIGLVLETYKEFDNFDILLKRGKPYNQAGRIQNENDAKLLDIEIEKLLNEKDVDYYTFTANKLNATAIVDAVVHLLNDRISKNDK